MATIRISVLRGLCWGHYLGKLPQILYARNVTLQSEACAASRKPQILTGVLAPRAAAYPKPQTEDCFFMWVEAVVPAKCRPWCFPQNDLLTVSRCSLCEALLCFEIRARYLCPRQCNPQSKRSKSDAASEKFLLAQS